MNQLHIQIFKTSEMSMKKFNSHSIGRQLTTINIWNYSVETLFINMYIVFYILYRTIHNIEVDTHVYKFALYLDLHLMKGPLFLETSNAIQISFLDKRYNQILY